MIFLQVVDFACNLCVYKDIAEVKVGTISSSFWRLNRLSTNTVFEKKNSEKHDLVLDKRFFTGREAG